VIRGMDAHHTEEVVRDTFSRCSCRQCLNAKSHTLAGNASLIVAASERGTPVDGGVGSTAAWRGVWGVGGAGAGCCWVCGDDVGCRGGNDRPIRALTTSRVPDRSAPVGEGPRPVCEGPRPVCVVRGVPNSVVFNVTRAGRRGEELCLPGSSPVSC
jgi:hypothetical protein